MAKQPELDENELMMAERLKKLREHLKLTQKEVSEASNTNQGQLSGMEMGRSHIQLRVLKFYAEQYRANSSWILTGEGEMFLGEKAEKKEGRAATLDVAGGLLKIDASGLIQKLEKMEAEIADLRGQLGSEKGE